MLKRINYNVLLHFILLAFLAGGTGYALARQWYFPAGILAMATTTGAAFMWRYQTRTNRQIAYFFNAVRNNDFSLVFNRKVTGRSFRELQQSLIHLNNTIKEARLKSRTDEQLYRSLLEHAASGLISFDSEGKIREMNNAAKRLLSVYEALHVSQLGVFDSGLGDSILSIKPDHPRVLSVKTDHGIQELLFLATEFVSSNNEVLTILSIENIHKELSHKELESYVKIIRVLTHEIMNTLTPITSLSSSTISLLESWKAELKRDGLKTGVLHEAIEAIREVEDTGKGMIEFSESYREVMQVPQPVMGPVDLAKFLNRMVMMARHHPMGDRVEFRVSVKTPGLQLVADEELISRVIMNLCVNAIQATQKNGTNPVIALTANQDSLGNIVIEVSDNGPGIEKEITDRIFIPFFTTKEKGSGIGLSLCRQIMHLHNGSIHLDPSVSQGATFVLRFSH